MSSFMKDLAARYVRTALQIFFTSVTVGGVTVFDDAAANQITGAVLLIASLIPTAFSAWKANR